jgi:hypothetical protein
MRMHLAFAAGLSVAALVGCSPSGSTSSNLPDLLGFNPGNGPDGSAASCGAGIYPCGPYGSSLGNVIDNLALVGQKDDNMNGTPTDDPVRPIHFSDYYQDKSLKILVVLVAAEWCVPCQMEQSELITSWQKYQTNKNGVAYLEAIIEDIHHAPADMTTVDRWAGRMWPPSNLKIPFDMAADPTVALGPYYDIAAFPMQMVIQTSDMTIQWQNNGYSPGALEAAVNTALGI